MLKKMKIIVGLLVFLFIIPCVQANVFDDIREINQGIKNANEELKILETGINDLNNQTSEVGKNVLLIEETNKGIKNMSGKLDGLSNQIDEALGIKDDVGTYVQNIKFLLTIGIITIICAILTLIGTTFVILKRRK